MRYRVMMIGLVLPAVLLAAQEPLPRFRAGANLVRVDTYVSKDSVPVTDLKAEDFTVYEDDKPQKVETFEVVQVRASLPQTARLDPTSVRDMRQDTQDAARVFTLFFDRHFVQLSGSAAARGPVIDALDKIVGPDDMIGAMMPGMAPTAVTYSRKTGSIERFLTETWHWGDRFRDDTMRADADPEIRGCSWADDSATLTKYREQQTLASLKSLVDYLEGLRPERKFVMVFTEGWPLMKYDDRMAPKSAGVDTPTTDPRTGGLRRQDAPVPGTNYRTDEGCARTQSMLAFADHELEFRELLQRANRANVSFYPIDTRGLVAFVRPIDKAVSPSADQAMLRDRYENLRTMAAQTDGQAILNSGEISKSMQKVFVDVGSYYLLSYYSTNQKLDGRFRRIRVEVNRQDVDVRSRPGYLAPTESEARAAGVESNRPGAKPLPPPAVTKALDAIAPARGNLPIRIQAVGARNTIRAIVELDAATAKQPEWSGGGTLKVTFEPERSGGGPLAAASTAPVEAQTITQPFDIGSRSVTINGPERPLAPGRYSVRAELMPRGGRSPIQVTTFVAVPADASEIGTGGLASKRGPSTGLAYVATADPRFRRTERLRLEVPLSGEGFTGSGRLLTAAGQATPVVVTFTTRTDESTKQSYAVGDVTLAPLAEGEYVVELSIVKGGKTETVNYGFRLIP